MSSTYRARNTYPDTRWARTSLPDATGLGPSASVSWGHERRFRGSTSLDRANRPATRSTPRPPAGPVEHVSADGAAIASPESRGHRLAGGLDRSGRAADRPGFRRSRLSEITDDGLGRRAGTQDGREVALLLDCLFCHRHQLRVTQEDRSDQAALSEKRSGSSGPRLPVPQPGRQRRGA